MVFVMLFVSIVHKWLNIMGVIHLFRKFIDKKFDLKHTSKWVNKISRQYFKVVQKNSLLKLVLFFQTHALDLSLINKKIGDDLMWGDQVKCAIKCWIKCFKKYLHRKFNNFHNTFSCLLHTICRQIKMCVRIVLFYSYCYARND